MDRDLEKSTKSQNQRRDLGRVDTWASRFADETNPLTPIRHTTRAAASSKPHYSDGTFNKEFYR